MGKERGVGTPIELMGAALAGGRDGGAAVGMLYDVDALMIDYQLERSATTPLEARKGYRNLWWTFSKNAINDFTENAIIYIMADPAPAPGN